MGPGLGADAQAARRRRLLHACGDVDGVAGERVVRLETGAQRHFAGVRANAQRKALHTMFACHPFGVFARGGQDVQPGQHGLRGIVFACALGAEAGLQAIAGVAQHTAAAGAHAVGRALQHAQGRVTPQLQGSLDLGWSLPWRHSALWSRTALGASRGAADNPLANFYFGGFGNNRVDNGPVQRYREPGALPGFEIDAVAGRSFVRQQIDLLLPRVLFTSAGVPDLHATWLRPQLFAAALWTEPGRASARRFGTVGAQLDLRLGLLHWYELVLSAGYGVGFTGGQRTGSEWMLSLKVM